MISLVGLISIVMACLLLEAFFSGSEIAFVSANRPKIFRQAKENFAPAILVKQLLSRPELLFSTTVVGTTLAMNCATTVATIYIIQQWGYSREWINLVTLTPIILIFGEFIPKMLFRAHADQAVLKTSRIVLMASFVLYPITKLLSLYAHALKRIFGGDSDKGFFLSREEIKAALPASRGSDVTASERNLVERILEFNRITAKEMLRPLIEVIAIEDTQTIEEAIKLLSESAHSRLPVYQERIDRIIGVVQGFDCLAAPDLSQPISSIMQPPLFVPESKPLDELLLELKTRPMAVAVNEFGGSEGIITMEDVMEEVVGEIEDEYDEPPKLFHKIGDNSFVVNARMEIHDLQDILRLPVPHDEDYQTLGGFLLKRMQKIPKKWDSIVIDGIEYVVQSATDRSIEEVYVVIKRSGQ